MAGSRKKGSAKSTSAVGKSTGQRANKSAGKKTSGAVRKSAVKKSSSAKKPAKTKAEEMNEKQVALDITLVVIFAASILIVLSNFGMGGSFGSKISNTLFGCFGALQFILPFLVIGITVFAVANIQNRYVIRKTIGMVGFVWFFMALVGLVTSGFSYDTRLIDYFRDSSYDHLGAGWMGGVLIRAFSIFGLFGVWFLVFTGLVVFGILTTQKPIFANVPLPDAVQSVVDIFHLIFGAIASGISAVFKGIGGAFSSIRLPEKSRHSKNPDEDEDYEDEDEVEYDEDEDEEPVSVKEEKPAKRSGSRTPSRNSKPSINSAGDTVGDSVKSVFSGFRLPKLTEMLDDLDDEDEEEEESEEEKELRHDLSRKPFVIKKQGASPDTAAEEEDQENDGTDSPAEEDTDSGIYSHKEPEYRTYEEEEEEEEDEDDDFSWLDDQITDDPAGDVKKNDLNQEKAEYSDNSSITSLSRKKNKTSSKSEQEQQIHEFEQQMKKTVAKTEMKYEFPSLEELGQGSSQVSQFRNLQSYIEPVKKIAEKYGLNYEEIKNEEFCGRPVKKFQVKIEQDSSIKDSQIAEIFNKYSIKSQGNHTFEFDSSIVLSKFRIQKIIEDKFHVKLSDITLITDSAVMQFYFRTGSKFKLNNKESFTKELEKTFNLRVISFEPSKNGFLLRTSNNLIDTAEHLQQTFDNFKIKANVLFEKIACGPTVTQYQIKPGSGVKVSKIVSLADDIKLSLGTADVRFEAPIPGKNVVGIEVPNKTNQAVYLRDLLETNDFKEMKSRLAFGLGMDIAGKPVIADIAKMPHLLIAGATGSGKSVCINTLIMSILYKAKPDEVKLIMIDPKVVELSVYNGIPHLLRDVVTDPKMAAGALNWAVQEMTKRYNAFAEYHVRDMKGYNEKVSGMPADEKGNRPQPFPQIVIIVDELADLMMVAPGEVEEAICRLAQLARAAGIHLIIATQRPSVNVITGLIKANMPTRIAFSVSSGVDSRTILDMVGAEKLLGKGDMLYKPQNLQKPVRLQGAFVTDDEVSKVVDFLKTNNPKNDTSNKAEKEITQQMNSLSVSTTIKDLGNSEDERDQLFGEAGKFIIEKDKASIGMLQRVFKIGFNRAARIMDQLCEAGVVGPEEGTKPRKILMSYEQFEQYLEEYV